LSASRRICCRSLWRQVLVCATGAECRSQAPLSAIPVVPPVLEQAGVPAAAVANDELTEAVVVPTWFLVTITSCVPASPTTSISTTVAATFVKHGRPCGPRSPFTSDRSIVCAYFLSACSTSKYTALLEAATAFAMMVKAPVSAILRSPDTATSVATPEPLPA
jgi:hypothetical protein